MTRSGWLGRGRLFTIATVAFATACGSKGSTSSSTDFAFPDDASPAVAAADLVAFSHLTNSMPTEVTVGSAKGWAIIDTGNPWVLLDPATFTSVASLPVNGGDIPAITIGAVTTNNVYTIGSAEGDLMGDTNFTIVGNVGCTVLCGTIASLNYRDVTFTLGNVAPPADLLQPVTQTFSLEGGGVESGIVVPKSRVVVSVSIEGKGYSMIVDTGASEVTVSSAAFTALTSDGRVTLGGGNAETTSGVSSLTLTRAASVVVGGVTANGVVIAHDSSFDQNLAALSTDVGHTIDGSLGGTFLQNFYVSIDYATQKLTLTPYANTDFIIDQGEHLGLTLSNFGASIFVVATASGDAAAKGVAEGDSVTAIDGQELASLTPLQVATLLYGKAGATRLVTFGMAGTLTGMSVPILVEDSLPLLAATGG